MKAVDKIIAAFDFSSISEAVLEYAGELAEQLQAELVVVHVINKRDIESIEAAMRMSEKIKKTVHIEEYVDAVKKERETRIGELVENKVSERIAAQVQLRVGVPFQELIRIAAQVHADLIVMGTKGRTSVDEAMYGSTAAKVFQYSPIPVLSIR